MSPNAFFLFKNSIIDIIVVSVDKIRVLMAKGFDPCCVIIRLQGHPLLSPLTGNAEIRKDQHKDDDRTPSRKHNAGCGVFRKVLRVWRERCVAPIVSWIDESYVVLVPFNRGYHSTLACGRASLTCEVVICAGKPTDRRSRNRNYC